MEKTITIKTHKREYKNGECVWVPCEIELPDHSGNPIFDAAIRAASLPEPEWLELDKDFTLDDLDEIKHLFAPRITEKFTYEEIKRYMFEPGIAFWFEGDGLMFEC